MLRLFRKHREKLLKYGMVFFLGIVSFSMVVMLTPLGGGGTGTMQANVLATINGSDITTQDLQQQFDAQFRNSPYGNNPTLVKAMAPNMLDEMVLERALIGQAKKLGLEVSNQELQQSLARYLTVNGQFVGMAQYKSFVEQQYNMTVAQFEAQQRDQLLRQKVQDVITDSVAVSPAEVHAEFVEKNQKARVQYALFEPTNFTKAVEVTPALLDAYFKQNAIRYQVPDERQVRYVLIDPDHARALVKVSDEDLKAYYTQHLSDYRVADRVMLSQILFKTTGKSDAEVKQITAKAEDVLKQIQGGAGFADLAKKDSEDDASAPKGGDLGWLGRGQMVKEMADAAFAMKPGQVSGLVKTSYGIVILKLAQKQTAHLQSFDEVKDAIRATVEKQKLDQAQKSLADQLETQLKAQPQNFDAVVAKLGLASQETPLFKFNDPVPDLGKSEAFENLAFELKLGEVGQPITLPKGVAIIQVAAIVPQHLPKLDEVKAQVEEDYRAQQSRTLAAAKAQEFAAKAKTGDFKKLAQSMGLTVTESKDFTSQDNVPGLGSGSELSEAFTLQPGQTSNVIQVGSNSAVFQVLTHTPADESTFSAQQDQVREQLLEQKRELAFEIYRQNLKKELLKSGKLKINQDAMKQFIAGVSGG
ncbi:MAG TPA: peptidyl-prolyl cis-trans isomerase [Terriglobia bacterium]|nr:peptidyl-prolyl cis-trans isomerase [Terriglobia bacterium]